MKLLEKRAALMRDVRRFFETRDFVEVETPLLVPSPGLDVHLDAYEVVTDATSRFLITSPEYQMKRLLADGFQRIFQVCKCFRRGEFGSRHNPEFTMLEWYRTHAGIEEMIHDTEELVASLTGGSICINGHTISTAPPFARISVRDAFTNFAGVDEATMLAWAKHDEDTFFRTLVDKIEPGLAALPHAVVVHSYPTEQASLARKNPTDARYAERFEVYAAGVELCNGFGELTDPVEQRARFEKDQHLRRERGLPVYPIDERFVAAMDRGIPPSGGNALGLDRIIALACGTTEIRNVMSFISDEL